MWCLRNLIYYYFLFLLYIRLEAEARTLPSPDLQEFVHIARRVDEFDELFVGRGIGVVALALLHQLLGPFQVHEERGVDEVRTAQHVHCRLQH